MGNEKFDVKAQRKVFKAGSLMGPRSGNPTVVETDSEGKLTRIRPLHYTEYCDWESKNPWKMEAHGKTFSPPTRSLTANYYMTYKKRVYSENRVRYPLKRVDWDPDGDRHTENRGKSKYVRISWDEAAEIVAKELLRIREKYGMSAVLSETDLHGEGKHVAPAHGCPNRLLSLLGGYTVQMRNLDSWEGFAWGSKNVWGSEPVGQLQPSGNVWPDVAKYAEALFFWSADPETTSVGFDGYLASRMSYWLHSLGVKFIFIDPALNYCGCCQADKWIPILPNTDAALYLAIIHTWLKEGTYDKEYVSTHAVGCEPFFDYVLGKVDGVAKDPEWASEKCGVSVWTIKALARYWAKKIVTVTIGNGGPGIRGPFSTEPARLQSICLSMQGLGKPGRFQVKWTEWNIHTPAYALPYQGETIINIPHRCEMVRPAAGITDDPDLERGMFRLNPVAKSIPELAELCKTMETPPQQFIPKCMVHDAILKDHIEWYGLDYFCAPAKTQWIKHTFPREGCSRIHAVWTDSPCMTTCWNDGFNYVKAMRSPEIEFIVAQHPWLENDCYMADIILPVATRFEMDEISDDANSGIITSVFRELTACPPVGESLSDFDCVAEVAKKIGDEFYQAYTGNVTSIEKIIELFWQGSGVAHLDVDDDYHKKGIFVMPIDPQYKDRLPGIRPFAIDPEKYPLQTPTGKLEFTSTAIEEHFPEDDERPPYPKWVEKSALHDERLSSERAAKYPLLCMSNHGRWRFHANLDDITWHREVETMKIRAKDGYQYEPMWIHPSTAAERGIAHGDIVRIFNERGTVLCAAYVTERLIPGVVSVDHGSRFDPIDAESLDRGGAINLITPHAITSKTVTGMVVSGFLVEVQKVSDEEMNGWKEQYPHAFMRETDQGCGVCLNGWMLSAQEEE